ncbi:MAG TPA: metalloregulator ArsR/SmtB family transcription factor [Anaerolineales bacterium]
MLQDKSSPVIDDPAKLFKILMHPARLSILDILRDSEHCVCHMESHLGYRQAYISQQLMVLREAGLVEDRKDGLNVFYRVTVPTLYEVIDVARKITYVDEQIQEHDPHHEAKAASCPCPKCNPAAKNVSC